MSKAVFLAALAATVKSDPAYAEGLVAQRAGLSPGRLGSFYPGTGETEVREMWEGADWVEATDPDLSPYASGLLRAELPGITGVVPLSGLRPSAPVVLLDEKGGEELSDGRQKISATVTLPFADLPRADYSLAVLGALGKDDPTVGVWTVVCGGLVPPSMVDRFGSSRHGFATGEDRHGKIVSVSLAMEMGLSHAKADVRDLPYLDGYLGYHVGVSQTLLDRVSEAARAARAAKHGARHHVTTVTAGEANALLKQMGGGSKAKYDNRRTLVRQFSGPDPDNIVFSDRLEERPDPAGSGAMQIVVPCEWGQWKEMRRDFHLPPKQFHVTVGLVVPAGGPS